MIKVNIECDRSGVFFMVFLNLFFIYFILFFIFFLSFFKLIKNILLSSFLGRFHKTFLLSTSVVLPIRLRNYFNMYTRSIYLFIMNSSLRSMGELAYLTTFFFFFLLFIFLFIYFPLC